MIVIVSCSIRLYIYSYSHPWQQIEHTLFQSYRVAFGFLGTVPDGGSRGLLRGGNAFAARCGRVLEFGRSVNWSISLLWFTYTYSLWAMSNNQVSGVFRNEIKKKSSTERVWTNSQPIRSDRVIKCYGAADAGRRARMRRREGDSRQDDPGDAG